MALEELAERVNGDMRMALNELQYMNLRTQVVKFDDVKARLRSSGKDEDMSPFTAVDRCVMSFKYTSIFLHTHVHTYTNPYLYYFYCS